MSVDANGRWNPSTGKKQDYLRAVCRDRTRNRKFILADGTRLSGKTVGCLHAVTEHAWNVRNANVALITISQTVGFDSGIWKDLTEVIIPEWIEGNFGLEWVKQPWIQGVSKKPVCQIRNIHGGTSTIQLESLKNEQEVEDRFKPRRYSMIYVPELTTFKSRKTFTTWTECLRMLGLPSEDHVFLADTNPDSPEHWVYKVWFELLESDESEIDPLELPIKKNLVRIDFDLTDNIWDTPERIAELKAKYAHDPDLYARYILGKWTGVTEDCIFIKEFRHNVHVQGELETKLNPEPLILVPEEGCYELIGGWDLGVTNSAAVIAEKTHRMDKKTFTDENGKESLVDVRVSVIKYLDELVITGETFDMADFVLEFMEKMDYWEKVIGHEGTTVWRHWSDRSAWDMQEPVHNKFHHQIVAEASENRILLTAAERGPGSVAQRVDLHKKLLFEERIFYSASKCPKLIEMNKSLRRGTSGVAVIQKGSKHKHPFDASSYIEASECYDEINRKVMNSLLKKKNPSGTLVSVPV